MASMQYYKTAEQANYDYITSTNYQKPALAETYHNGTYANHHGHGYGNHGTGGQAHYGHVAHSGHIPPHGYSNTHYGQHQNEHGIIKTHTDSFSSYGTGYGHHHKTRPAGYHGSGKTHAYISERRAMRIRKKREDGCSDYSSDSCSDSDHE